MTHSFSSSRPQESTFLKIGRSIQSLFSNPFAPYVVSILLWYLCARAQIYLTEYVSMPIVGGHFIIQLTFGARFVSIYAFGFKGLLGVLIAPLFYIFAFSESTYDTPIALTLALMTIDSTMIFIAVALEKMLRKHEDGHHPVNNFGIYLIVFCAAFASALLQDIILPHTGIWSILVNFTLSFISKIVGAFIVFYSVLMLILWFGRKLK